MSASHMLGRAVQQILFDGKYVECNPLIQLTNSLILLSGFNIVTVR